MAGGGLKGAQHQDPDVVAASECMKALSNPEEQLPSKLDNEIAHLLQVSIEVNHCLLVSPGVQKKDVRRVISHYQALAQVENYVRKMPGVTREAVDDTAGAAKMVAQEGWRYSRLAQKTSSWVESSADFHHIQ